MRLFRWQIKYQSGKFILLEENRLRKSGKKQKLFNNNSFSDDIMKSIAPPNKRDAACMELKW